MTDKKEFLNNVDDIFAKDLQDATFANHVQEEMNFLESAIAVRTERESYGWTQQNLAEKANLPQSTIARVEKGANINMKTISKIANAFGKSVKISFK